MMLVYRVESSDGRGPYNPLSEDANKRAFGDQLIDHHSSFGDRSHPPPRWDKGIDRSMDATEYAGFAGRRQLTEWFNGWGGKLRSHGFRVNLYRIPDNDVTTGERQCIFYRGDHKPIRSYDPIAIGIN